MIESLAWCLPRPRKTNKFKGGFPLHFENKLLRELGLDPWGRRILQPFGGMAEHGIRLDIRPDLKPHIVGDAHYLPFRDNTFDLVLLDPPYSAELSKELYSTGPVHFTIYMAEAARVAKPGGFVVLYHFRAMPRPPGCHLVKRILLETRLWHHGRIIHIHQKDRVVKGGG